MEQIVSILLSAAILLTSSACGAISPPQAPLPDNGPAVEKTEKKDVIDITLTIGAESFDAALENNETTRALTQGFPMTLAMDELNGNEKFQYLAEALPVNPGSPGQLHAGDLMLFGDDCLVLFYEGFQTSYSYTRLGSVTDAGKMAEALGRGSVTITFAIKEN